MIEKSGSATEKEELEKDLKDMEEAVKMEQENHG